ncbi:MAG TPA: nucleotidyltransferase family protein [Chryseosolibacter sp.]|nr:nucleotidyltransferase family protein [Chryseosolibacter sp.]
MYSGAIILAAGSSSRMGQPKQMLDIHGEKLLVKTIQTVLHSGINAVTVVLGADEEAHRKLIRDLPVDVVYNEQWQAGMGSSLKTGLVHLTTKHPSLEAVIVLVCDQPLLTPQAIHNLFAKYQETKKPVVASRYSEMPGVPALFNKKYFEKLAALPDDQGAKKIILQNPADVAEVDFPGGEVDLDTMEDYNAFVKS